MIIDINLQIDTEKDGDNELGEILVGLLTSLKHKLDQEDAKIDTGNPKPNRNCRANKKVAP